jgi:hypothetical protein
MSMHHNDGTRHPPVSKVPCPHPECQPRAAPITPERLSELRVLAMDAVAETPTTEVETMMHGASVTILALLDRIAKLEEQIRTRDDAALERSERD